MVCLNKRGGLTALRPKLIKKIDLSGRSIEVRQGDLTLELTEAVVNAANSKLDHASGIAGALRVVAGPEFEEDSAALIREQGGSISVGDAVVTRAGGALQCRHVIHAVGPMWRGGAEGEALLLAGCVRRSLELADELRLGSIAIPAISSGIFGYPKPEAARVIVDALYAYLDAHPQSALRSIHLTNIDDETVAIFSSILGDEAMPLTSVPRWIAGPPTGKQVLRVVHGSPAALQRAKSHEERGVVVVDFANWSWEIISPTFGTSDLAEVRIALQQAVRDKIRANSAPFLAADEASRTPSIPVFVDVAGVNRRVVVASLRSNKFDLASFEHLVGVARHAIVTASMTQAGTIAVPLLGAGVLGYPAPVCARAVVQAASDVLKTREDRGAPLDIALCEGNDTAFFVKEVTERWTLPTVEPVVSAAGESSGTQTSPLAVVASYSAPEPLAFTAVSPTGSQSPDTSGSGVALPTPPPANETPAQRRARLRAEAEAKYEVRKAQDNP
jgi:O-acetyl-ADP-ribose deacetylase (regulator of RNase III)